MGRDGAVVWCMWRREDRGLGDLQVQLSPRQKRRHSPPKLRLTASATPIFRHLFYVFPFLCPLAGKEFRGFFPAFASVSSVFQFYPGPVCRCKQKETAVACPPISPLQPMKPSLCGSVLDWKFCCGCHRFAVTL